MTNPVLTDELIAELEAAANAATPGSRCTDGDLWVMARDSDQLNNGFVIAICDGPDGRKNAEYMAKASASVILALLAERADLKQQLAAASVDAERYRLFAETVAAEFAGETLTGSRKALFELMNSREEIAGVADVAAIFDAALATAAD